MKTLWILFYLIKRFPMYVIGYFTSEILTALPQYVGNVLFLKYLMRAIMDHEPLNKMLIILAGTAVFLIAADVYHSWFANKVKPCEEERIQNFFDGQMINAVQRQELFVYDMPEFHDDIVFVSENIVKDSLALLSYVGKATASVVNIILIINLFYEVGVGVLLIALGSVILSALFEVPVTRLKNNKKQEVKRSERKRTYYLGCFLKRDSFFELKMTGIVSLLYTKYESCMEDQISCEKQYGVKLFFLKFLRDFLSSNLLMSLVLIGYLLYEILVTKTLLGSDFIATYNAANVIMGAITEIIILWGQMAESCFSVGKYQNLIRSTLQTDILAEEALGEIYSIEFKNVSFVYPGTEKTVLKNISFHVNTGEKVAVVGRNGSGKTTLIHLLMGLYYPTEGEIVVNGKVLNKKEYPMYRRSFAAFFQGMKPIEATAAENVALDTDFDLNQVCSALQRTSDDHVFSNPEKMVIGVQFDSHGRVLSGGECQRLMLAHCFYSNKSVLVMDEPSSALDPAAEREFNLKVFELSNAKLTIFVTHRLSTVHMADYIYVIDDGMLCDQGSHDQLLKRDGVYKEMWNIQLEKYGYK